MNASGGKIITALRERWQIEHEIQALLNAGSEQDFTERAQRVAASGDQVIPVILGHLNRSTARTLSALGIVASLYPHRERILNKLYQAAADPDRPDRGRVSAILILERFLDQEPDPYLIGTLSDPRAMAIESVKEMMREGERNLYALVDYAHILAAQPEETIEGVIETLLEVGKERAIPALCLLAQGDVDVMARAALSALGRLNHPDAALGLQSIMPLLSPAYRPLSERSLLKLRFSQVAVSRLPAANSTWRALVSPVDGKGNQVVWYIEDSDQRGNCRFLGLSINDSEGIQQAYGNIGIPVMALPERRWPGYVHRLSLDQGTPTQATARSPDRPSSSSRQENTILYMLETDLDYGRRLAWEGQSLNFERGNPFPVEYRLLGPWLWQYDDTHIDANRQFPPMSELALDLLAETSSILLYPPFRGWFANGDQILRHSRTVPQPPSRRWTAVGNLAIDRTVAEKLATEYFDEGTIGRLRTRLEAMSEWLWRAGDARLAKLAMVAAVTIATMSPAEHPLTLSMVELGLNVAAHQPQRQ